jgi:hypothetical protein
VTGGYASKPGTPSRARQQVLRGIRIAAPDRMRPLAQTNPASQRMMAGTLVTYEEVCWMAKRGTDHWSETYCDRRYHPPHLRGTPYWFFCRLEPGHGGDCDCEAAHEATNTRE